MLGGITFRRLEFGRRRRRVEKCRSTLTAELISWRVRSSACRARRVKPCPTFTAKLHSGGILMLAMRAPHSKGPMSSTIFWLIEDEPENTSIYCTLCVTRIALAKTIVSKTTHSSDMFSAQIAFTDSNQLGGDDLAGKLKVKVDPLPNSLSTQILSPCSSTNFLANVNPSPVPSPL